MTLKRRDFINFSSIAAAAGITTGMSTYPPNATAKRTSIPDLRSMTADVVPVTMQEIKARIEKAQGLLTSEKMGALILDAGTSMKYFTGISWWPSERPMVAIIPAKGDPKYVCPGFEEARLRESVKIGKDVYAWQEDESPFKYIVTALTDAGIQSGKIGIEERVRFFIFDGIRKAGSDFNYVSGDPVTIPCRMIKSTAEIALMQKASDITIAAIKHGISQLHEGMKQAELTAIIEEAQQKSGGSSPDALVLFDKSSSFPHGSAQPQSLKKGEIVLMDCGCKVEGYTSDITRTIVFGAEPTKHQLDIWNLEQRAQSAAFSAAKIGASFEEVDAAARKVITNAGFGPGYKLPGLPHRTGHGIGMDGHEWGNVVNGNKQILAPGMCFSLEPTISLPDEFGVRLEDCVYMTESGPRWFSQPAKSISEPFA
ncbi:MAG TPA: Xaa-Pro peptidase family protein [Chryseolinea sp.]|nr:Xaa-Pro peptidase family protein [Chryseolinea sp.]